MDRRKTIEKIADQLEVLAAPFKRPETASCYTTWFIVQMQAVGIYEIPANLLSQSAQSNGVKLDRTAGALLRANGAVKCGNKYGQVWYCIAGAGIF